MAGRILIKVRRLTYKEGVIRALLSSRLPYVTTTAWINVYREGEWTSVAKLIFEGRATLFWSGLVDKVDAIRIVATVFGFRDWKQWEETYETEKSSKSETKKGV